MSNLLDVGRKISVLFPEKDEGFWQCYYIPIGGRDRDDSLELIGSYCLRPNDNDLTPKIIDSIKP